MAKKNPHLQLTVTPQDVEFGRRADAHTAALAEALETHPLRIARRKADEANIPRTTYLTSPTDFITPEQRSARLTQALEKGLIASPAIGTAALSSGAWLGPAARMVVEGTKNPVAIAAMSGIGAGTEMLEDKPSPLGAAAKAAQWAAMARMPISEALTYVPEAEAGVFDRIPGTAMEIIRRNWPEAHRLVGQALNKTARTGNEHAVLSVPDWQRLIPGDAGSVSVPNSLRDSFLREATMSPEDKLLLHTHRQGSSVVPSHADVSFALPGGVREAIVAPSAGKPLVMYSRTAPFSGKDYPKYVKAVSEHFEDPRIRDLMVEKGFLDPDYPDTVGLAEVAGPMSYLRNLSKGDKLDVWYNDLGTFKPSPSSEKQNYADMLKVYWDESNMSEGGSVQKFAGGGLALLRKALTGQLAREAGTTPIIKEKGGNWLSGSVEGALSGLKSPYVKGYQEAVERYGPETAHHYAARPPVGAGALNNWIDKQLTRYVKNEMATPEDPIRALAERGVLHVPHEQLNFRPEIHGKYLGPGQKVVAKELPAKAWEGASDLTISPRTAGEQLLAEHPNNAETMPWLKKVDPETTVYGLGEERFFPEDLGFDHLIDELSNALNPESGLPRHLLLDPASLPRVSVPQAVERVAKINEWRAAQKAEADALKANNAATVLYKEYPENNPLGLRWVELKSTGNVGIPEGYTVEPNSTYLGKTGYQLRRPNGDRVGTPQPTEEAAFAQLNESGFKTDKALADALKYEGDTMGHCVGGYCDDVLSGRSRIFSLRDAKGQPHVTIETSPQPYEGFDPHGDWEKLPEELQSALMKEYGSGNVGWTAKIKNDPRVKAWETENIPITPDRIIQIKGKQNRAPNPEYLPFVQDFVKSGKWSDVGDLRNAGLGRIGDQYLTPDEILKIHSDVASPNWIEANNYLQSQIDDFASGGSVKPNFADPAIINAIFMELQHG